MNYHTILEVTHESTMNEIKRSFIEKIKKIHPDKNSAISDSDVNLLITAYKVLSNENTRNEYEQNFKIGSQFKAGYADSNLNITEIDQETVVLSCNQCESENVVSKKILEEFEYYECMSCNYNVFLAD